MIDDPRGQEAFMNDHDTRQRDAADRTIAVLKKKVLDLYSGASGSALHRQVERAQQRDEENRRKREISELRAAELQRYSEALEREVAQRTRASKTILDHVTFGFLIVDRHLVVQPEATRSCSALLGAARVEGENLCDLLGLGDTPRGNLLLGVDQVFEDLMPEEVSLDQLQRKFKIEGRTLDVAMAIVRAEDGAVSGLLLTLSDISALEAATRENDHNQMLIGILRQKEPFRDFLTEAKSQLDEAARGVIDGDVAVVRRAIHTVKGNSASYGLIEVVATIHRIEDHAAVTSADIEEIGRAIRSLLAANHSVLAMTFEEISDASFAVSNAQMSQLKTLIAGIGTQDGDALRRWTHRILERPASQLLGPVEDFTHKLARRLDKRVSFTLAGGETPVDVDTMRPVFQVLTHLLRNALDHGIESPDAREAKPDTATVRLEIISEPHSIVVRCEDDGRGIDTELLGQRALEKGLISPADLARLTEHERLALVFLDGLSSAAVATSISGRGAGMSAVRAVVERAGGTISILSTRGQGTVFTLTVPRPRELAQTPSQAPPLHHAA